MTTTAMGWFFSGFFGMLSVLGWISAFRAWADLDKQRKISVHLINLLERANPLLGPRPNPASFGEADSKADDWQTPPRGLHPGS